MNHMGQNRFDILEIIPGGIARLELLIFFHFIARCSSHDRPHLRASPPSAFPRRYGLIYFGLKASFFGREAGFLGLPVEAPLVAEMGHFLVEGLVLVVLFLVLDVGFHPANLVHRTGKRTVALLPSKVFETFAFQEGGAVGLHVPDQFGNSGLRVKLLQQMYVIFNPIDTQGVHPHPPGNGG